MEISTEDKGEYFLNQNKSDPKLVNLKKKKKENSESSLYPFCLALLSIYTVSQDQNRSVQKRSNLVQTA